MSAVYLLDVYDDENAWHAINMLYLLLCERTPEQSISHRKMPSFPEHAAFVHSRPYEAWYLIRSVSGEGNKATVGATYLTERREIGIFIFKDCQGKGYGKAAVKLLMDMHPGPFYANVSPFNTRSSDFFVQLGFRLHQITYAKD